MGGGRVMTSQPFSQLDIVASLGNGLGTGLGDSSGHLGVAQGAWSTGKDRPAKPHSHAQNTAGRANPPTGSDRTVTPSRLIGWAP